VWGVLILRGILVCLILLLILIFQISNIKEAYCAVLLDRIVATVNDEVITWSELVNVILIDGKPYLDGLSDEMKDKKIKELEKIFLNELIDMKLQLQEARKMGLSINDAEIDGAIAEIKEKYNLTDETLLNSLKAEGLTMEDYRSRLADQILLQKVVNYAVKSNVVISEKEIEEYYKANKEKYAEKEKLKIRQIFFALPEDESQKNAIEAKAWELVQRIKEGEDFAKLAGEFSEGPAREFGGDLGYISRGSVLKEVEEVAFSLKKGEVSHPFWSSVGLHIIKIEDRIGGEGLEKAREKIKEALFQKAVELKYHEWRSGLREKAYIEIKL
jgi:peptidyl-prolyl cis-trans isomerase SurA